jgi:hypothetical protein
MPLIPHKHSPTADAASRARTLFPSVVVGFLVLSAALFFAPASASVPLDTKQVIAAIWQPFPVYVAVAHSLLSGFDAWVHATSVRQNSTADNRGAIDPQRVSIQVCNYLRKAYCLSGALSALAHWTILFPSFFTSDQRVSFTHIFVPYPLHAFIGAAPSSLAPYRLSIRLLFQNDWLKMTVGAIIYFGWCNLQHTRRPPINNGMSFLGWTMRMAVLAVLGGSGASIAWAAYHREGVIAEVLTEKYNVSLFV